MAVGWSEDGINQCEKLRERKRIPFWSVFFVMHHKACLVFSRFLCGEIRVELGTVDIVFIVEQLCFSLLLLPSSRDRFALVVLVEIKRKLL